MVEKTRPSCRITQNAERMLSVPEIPTEAPDIELPDPMIPEEEPSQEPEQEPTEASEEETTEANDEETTESILATDPTESNALNVSFTSKWSIVALVLAALCVILAILLFIKSRKQSAQQNGSGRKHKKMRTKAPGSSVVLPVTVGKVHEQGARSDQQDSFSVSDLPGMAEYGLLAVVADGMGGLKDGGHISQCAASTMMEGFYSLKGNAQGVLLSLVERTVAAVNKELGEDGLNHSGSTLVAAIVKGNELHFASIGDSRISLYRSGTLMQLNRDHILRHDLEVRAINRQITWEAAINNSKAHGLTSFLGMGALKYVDIPGQPITLLPGDRVILMSDGVYNALTTQELCTELAKSAQAAADGIRAKVAAKNYQNQDNYTAIILAF